MSGENYVNTASTATTAAPVGPSDLTFVVASYTGWPAAPYWAEFEKGTASAEVVRVTNVAGTTLTITRGQGGTAATSHGAGVSFEHIVPASHFNETEVHMAATNAHGVTGVVVGTQGAQTVQDKTFRGAFKSNFTDALPVGVTASYESTADNSSGRDGFVHKNTAGDVARKGFLLQQSGTDRFMVRNDGTTDINPSASANPGLRNHGTTVLDSTASVGGALTVSAGGANITGGLTVPSGGAAITGNSTITGTANVSSTATVGSLTTAGTIHANGSIDTDTNLVVDGTSTLTGTVSAGGAVNATGAVTGASGTFTGALSAQAAKVASFNVAADYGFTSEISTFNGVATRSMRHPLVTRVHKGAVAVTISSTTNGTITTFQYTPRTTCHLSAHLVLQFQAASDGASGGPFEPTESSFQIRLNNAGNTVNHDSSNLYTVTVTASDGFSYRGWTVVPVNFSSTFLLTGGTTYTIEVWGARSTSSALSQILQKIEGDLQEVSIIADIT